MTVIDMSFGLLQFTFLTLSAVNSKQMECVNSEALP